jgi:hypothetical protein
VIRPDVIDFGWTAEHDSIDNRTHKLP